LNNFNSQTFWGRVYISTIMGDGLNRRNTAKHCQLFHSVLPRTGFGFHEHQRNEYLTPRTQKQLFYSIRRRKKMARLFFYIYLFLKKKKERQLFQLLKQGYKGEWDVALWKQIKSSSILLFLIGIDIEQQFKMENENESLALHIYLLDFYSARF